MKTFETEKNNIPEGATHHGVYGCDTDVYFKKDGDTFLRWKHNNWSLSEFAHHNWVKPIPKPETTEWNGEGLPPVGCKIKTKHGVSEVLSTSDWDGGVVTYSYDEGMSIACAWNNKSWINQIETEKQRKERERLEAAYDLYCDYCAGFAVAFCSFERFCDSETQSKVWLAIVDKTNCRKGE